jgi:hypothetical protein
MWNATVPLAGSTENFAVPLFIVRTKEKPPPREGGGLAGGR